MIHASESILRISGIVEESIVDGPGIRYVVFAQGCPHNCPGCHNPGTHSFDGGGFIEIDTIIEQIQKNPLLDGITLSGGEPFEQAAAFSKLAERIKESNRLGKLNLDIMVYTGYTYENLLKGIANRPAWKRLLDAIDILVDGPFQEKEKSYLLKFRGSKNQRIIHMEQTRLLSKVVLAEV